MSERDRILPGDYVLDTHALFAFLQREPGEQLVARLIERATTDVTLNLSLLNFGEIAYIAERERGYAAAQRILDDIRRLPITVREVSEERVWAAARIKAARRVSYADAFAVALAQELSATLVSGDPEIRALSHVVPVLWP
jgi:predicted nucleic acid-binding protein